MSHIEFRFEVVLYDGKYYNDIGLYGLNVKSPATAEWLGRFLQTQFSRRRYTVVVERRPFRWDKDFMAHVRFMEPGGQEVMHLWAPNAGVADKLAALWSGSKEGRKARVQEARRYGKA